MSAAPRRVHSSPFLPLLVPATACLLLSGCTEAVTLGDETTIRFNLLVRLCVALIPFAGIILCGFLALRRIQPVLTVLALLGLVAFEVVVVPGIVFDAVRTTPTAITQNTGFWFAPTRHRVDIPATRAVVLRTKTQERPHGPVVFLIWQVHRRDGHAEEFQLSDLWASHESLLLQKLRSGGVEVIDQRSP